MPSILRKLKRPRARRIVSTVACALAMVATTACEDDITDIDAIDRGDLVGAYDAIAFTVTTPTEGITDVLLAGGELTLTLQQDGGVTGSLFAPGLGPDDTDVDESFTGTWEFQDLPTNEVTLSFDSDFFTDQFELGAGESPVVEEAVQLDGEADFSGHSIAVILRQQVL